MTRSKDRKKLEEHNKLCYNVKNNVQIHHDYKNKRYKETLLEENRRVLRNLLRICDENESAYKRPNTRSCSYDEIKANMAKTKVRDRRNTMQTIDYGNRLLSRKLCDVTSTIAKDKFDKEWRNKKSRHFQHSRFEGSESRTKKIADQILSSHQTIAPKTIFDRIGFNEEPIDIRYANMPPLKTLPKRSSLNKPSKKMIKKRKDEANKFVREWRSDSVYKEKRSLSLSMSKNERLKTIPENAK